MPKFIIFLALIAIALGAYYFKYGFPKLETENSLAVRMLTIGGKTLEVEIADTLVSRKQGLSGKESLGDNQGMLFVYGEPGNYSFWMKDMKFAIDIIWIDENKKIVDIVKNISPDTFPQTFQPSSPAQYALEVNAGWTDKNFVRMGDLVEF